MNHEEASLLLGAYALDAVEPAEARAIEEHLDACPRCRHELVMYRESAAALGGSGGEAPPELWEQISARLADDAPPLAVFDRPRRPGRKWGRPPWATWSLRVVAAAAAVAIALLGWDASRLDARVGDLQTAISKQGVAQAASVAALSPSARRIELRSSSGLVRADVVILPAGQAFVLTSTLPALGDERTYQLWALSGGRAVSLGLLGSKAAPSAFKVDRRLTALMITSEPQGGVVAPTSPVLVRASLPPT
ncbi:MAG: anti-sigma factor domain-containing protein [Acidimicrobiales bacterium]